MQDYNSSAFLMFILISLPFFIGAYLIGKQGWLFLMAGWEPEKYSNHNAISKIFSWGLLISGLTSLSVAILDFLYLISNDAKGILILLSSVVVVLTGFYCNKKFRIKGVDNPVLR